MSDEAERTAAETPNLTVRAGRCNQPSGSSTFQVSRHGGRPAQQHFLGPRHPTRRAILERLADGEATVNELAEPFPVTVQAVSRHLKVLEHAGLITPRRAAQWRPARLQHPLEDAAGWLERYRQFFEGSFDRLDDHLRAIQKEPNG